MKTGNPKQALGLAIVAVGAIAFLVLRLFPHHGNPAVAESSRGDSSANRALTVNDLPVDVLRDAFSHPALTKRLLATESVAKPDPTDSRPTAPATLYGNIMPGVATWAAAAGANPKPGEIAVTDRQRERGPKSKIELKAIMCATKPIALLTIDNKADRSLCVGQRIDGVYRVTAITDNAIQIDSGRDRAWIQVGQEVTEK